jgi:hypothetical protein
MYVQYSAASAASAAGWHLIVLDFLIRYSHFITPSPKRSILTSKRNITMTILFFESHEIIEDLVKFSSKRPLETRIVQALNLFIR